MMKKLLSSMVLTTALSLGLTGCATTILFQETDGAIEPTGEAKKFAEDNVAGFVIQPDGKLIMVGENYVYVFNDSTNSQKLKKILATPEFLKLKEMSWYILDKVYDEHSLTYDPTNNRFDFTARFKFKPHSKQEAELLKKVGLYGNDDNKCCNVCKDGLTDEVFKCLQYDAYSDLNLSGTLYKHNESSKLLLKQAQPLSKKYNFTIYTYKNKIQINAGSLITRIALLPFTIVTDAVLFLPFNIAWALDGFSNPFD